jgi:hypothetical protein
MKTRKPSGIPIMLFLGALVFAFCLVVPAPSGGRIARSDGISETAPLVLVSRRTDAAPIVDGDLDDVWASAPSVTIPLNWGRHSVEFAFDLRLRALHTSEAIYFFSEWPGTKPSLANDALTNQLTMHFDLLEPWQGARDVMCLVSCHTAYADASGRLAYMSADTIPVGQTEPLSAAGGWQNGVWRLEWSRPLVNSNPFDEQFGDLGQSYPFFIKAFEHHDGSPDPVSATCTLLFEH